MGLYGIKPIENNIMNKQIKTLVGKALDQVVPYTWSSLGPAEVEKLMNTFAEFLVQDCAIECDMLLNDKMSSEWSRGTHDCSRAIRQRFGVE